jgi:hypothetical protein
LAAAVAAVSSAARSGPRSAASRASSAATAGPAVRASSRRPAAPASASVSSQSLAICLTAGQRPLDEDVVVQERMQRREVDVAGAQLRARDREPAPGDHRLADAVQQPLAGIGLGGRAQHALAPVGVEQPDLRVDIAQRRLRHLRDGEQLGEEPQVERDGARSCSAWGAVVTSSWSLGAEGCSCAISLSNSAPTRTCATARNSGSSHSGPAGAPSHAGKWRRRTGS